MSVKYKDKSTLENYQCIFCIPQLEFFMVENYEFSAIFLSVITLHKNIYIRVIV